jgi:hypothetical protein
LQLETQEHPTNDVFLSGRKGKARGHFFTDYLAI